MNDFEKELDQKKAIILKRTGAFIHRLEPPMRCCGTKGTMPVFVQVGGALFDWAGWVPGEMTEVNGYVFKYANCIGIEQKATKQRHPSMRIVGEDGDGSGIKAHQLEALASLHRSGGVARLLWNNGGVIGVLDGDEIAQAFYTYGVSLAAERMRKTPAKGSRSIPWSLFRVIDWIDHPEQLILAPRKKPTAKQEMDAKRRKAAKQIEEAERERAEQTDVEESGGASHRDDE
jgi:hypothetical protein